MVDKSLTAFISGVVLGALILGSVWFLKESRQGIENSDHRTHLPEVERGKDAIDLEIERLRKIIEEQEQLIQDEEETRSAGLDPDPGASQSHPGESRGERSQRIREAHEQKTFREARIFLDAALDLTADQWNLFDEIFLQLKEKDPMLGFRFGPMDLGPGSPLRDGLTPVLSPDQLATLDNYVSERRANEIEARASSQLIQLQHKLNLTAEQKDAIFQHYAEVAREEVESGDKSRSTEYFEARKREEKHVLSEILTHDQQATLQALEDQQHIFYEQMRGGTSIFTTSTVSGAAGFSFVDMTQPGEDDDSAGGNETGGGG